MALVTRDKRRFQPTEKAAKVNATPSKIKATPSKRFSEERIAADNQFQALTSHEFRSMVMKLAKDANAKHVLQTDEQAATNF